MVHRSHDTEQHGSVAYPGVEYAHCRWARMYIGQFESNPAGNHPLFTAGMHKQEIFLSIVKKSKVALRTTPLRAFYLSSPGPHARFAGVHRFTPPERKNTKQN